jgi:nucleolar GTP-binding protein
MQLVDSPGILDRGKLNQIEKQAMLAFKHLSTNVVFVIDPSESCGYTLEEQKKFLKKIRKQVGKVIVVSAKSDLSDKKIRGAIPLSIKNEQDITDLKDRLFEVFYKPYKLK